MNRRLLKSAAVLTVIPIVFMRLTFGFWGHGAMALELALLGVLTQVLAILWCRRELEPLFRPAADLLTHMGVEPVPAPYEPGKFRADFRVCSVLMWLGAPTPALCFLARGWTGGRSAMARAVPAGPSTAVLIALLVSFAMILLGVIAMGLWVKFGQAMVIANERGERKRYLYRGFAQEVYNRDRCSRYRKMRKLQT